MRNLIIQSLICGAILAAAALLLMRFAKREPTFAPVSIRVLDSDSKHPVAGVRLQLPSTCWVPYSGMLYITDVRGEASVMDYNPAAGVLDVSATGYKQQAVWIRGLTNGTIWLNRPKP
jgi:hypothetical protein